MTLLTSASRARGGTEPGLRRLSGVLFHLAQGYARHAGHLDIVSELADGQLGE